MIMVMPYKISIIIPVYKVEKYIIRCLKSVANQTYKGRIECILVDDCSPDQSLVLCEKFVNDYTGNIDFVIVRQPVNGGQSTARNAGTKLATGDYLYFLDSDDEIPESSIELLVSEAEKHQGIDVVMGAMYDDKQSEAYNLECYKPHQYVTDNRWLQFNIFKLGKTLPINSVNKLIRRGFVLDNGLYFKPGIIHEDDHWMFYVVKCVKSWAFVFENTYIRYWNEGSTMTFHAKKKDVEAINYFKIISDWYENHYEPFAYLQICQMVFWFYVYEMYRYVEDSKILYSKFLAFSKCRKHYLLQATLLLCNMLSTLRVSNSVIYRLSSIPYRIETKRIDKENFN